MTDSDPVLDLATLAFVAGAAANERILDRIRADGHPRLRLSHGYVFQRLLVDRPTIGELAASLGVTQQAASKVARELEGLGYVSRRIDAADRRITRLSLTERGVAAVESARRIRGALEGDLVASVGETEVDRAHGVLQTLLDQLGARESVRTRSVKPQSW